MPQHPPLASLLVVVVAAVDALAALVVVVPLLLAQQRADMVIRLALWRLWRLTSISILHNTKSVAYFWVLTLFALVLP